MIQKPVAGPKERLIDHLINVSNMALKLAKSLNISDAYIIKSLKIAALLHDIGKAFKIYQDNPSLAEEGKFPGHEILSTVISEPIMNSIDLSPEERSIVTYSIISHHQAMSSIYDRMKTLLKFFSCSHEESHLKNILLTMSGHLNMTQKEALDVYEQVTEPLLRISEIHIKRVNTRIKSFMNLIEKPLQIIDYSDETTLLKARICCGILMIADTYTAIKARGGKPTSTYRQMTLRLIDQHLKLH